jgi:putative membrane protein
VTRPSLATVAGAPLKGDDKAFVVEAASGGMAEVELGKLAKERGQSDVVKNFAQHMVEDHSKANGELAQLASKKGVMLPAQLLPKHKKTSDALAKETGAAFDKMYMREMVKDHENDVAAFQKEADSGKDAELVAWVKQTLPTLKAHLEMAKDAEAKVGKTSGSMDKPAR